MLGGCTYQQCQAIQSPLKSLPEGSYWSGNGKIHRTLEGTGNYTGTWASDTEYDSKFTIIGHSSDAIEISYEYYGSWSSRATDKWVKLSGGESNHGTTGPVRFDYTIDIGTMKIMAVSDNTYRGLVGVLALQLIDPQSLHQGGTVSQDWSGSTVNWTVGTSETIALNNVQVDVWPLSHSGNWYGSWHVGNNYSTGMITITYLYDKNYGIALRRTATGDFNYTGNDQGWSETLSDNFRVTDSNVFIRPSAFSLLMKPNTLLLVAAMIVAILLVAFLTVRSRRTHCVRLT